MALAAHAQTEVFNTSFASPPTLALQGSASFAAGRLRLTPASTHMAGGAWFPTKQFLQEGFETMFQFQLGSGGQGLAFVVQNNTLPALGRSGSGLGFDGVPNSVAVEFDAVSNTDITDLAGAHVSVQTRGVMGNSAADWLSIGSATASTLVDGGIHTARIRYVPGSLEVYLDDLSSPLVSAAVTLTNLFPLQNGQAWFGLVAANGAAGATQDVLNWSFHLAATPLTVALLSPLDGASSIAPATFMLEATTAGADPVTSVEFFAGTQRIFATNSGPYQFRWDFVLPGAYTLVAVATDSAGRKTASSPVRLVVSPSEPAIGVNFATAPNGSSFALTPPDNAGVIPQRYWNNAVVFTNGNGAIQNLRNAAGVITPIDIGYDFVARGEEPLIDPNASPDHALMRTHGFGPAGSNVVIQFQQIPYAIYDVLIYTDGANGGVDRVSQFRGPGSRNVFARDPAWTSFAGIYAAANGTSDIGAATPAGNYIRLNGLTTATLSITNNGAVGSINAIQIFPSIWDRSAPVILTRGPYLQMGTPHSMTVRWRSNRPVPSRVRYGTNAANLDSVAMDLTERQEHTMVLTNLQPDTRYYYSVGTTDTNLVSGTNYFFWTSPVTSKPTRVWVLGDSGTANANAAAVRDAFNALNGNRYVDVWLMLGDNAYNSGTDNEYQAAVFNMYTNTLPQTPLWPTIGNHETGQSHTPVPTTPYLSIFNLPTGGEAGGVPSGTERYYSFDYGNIHFVCLDSMTNQRITNGPMANWIHADLQANTNEWIIVFFHHPPYTKGSHDSDDPNGADFELVEMRENIVPILEAYGVDLVMSGHSHCYERSFPLQGHYGYSTELDPAMILDNRSGNPAEEGAGPYTKVSDGTIYIVDGSSGQATFGTLDHPVMYRSILNLGSVILDIHTNQLVARFLRETGEIQDTFTIIKQPAPPATPAIQITSDKTTTPGSVTVSNGSGEATEADPFQFGFIFEPVSQSGSVGADVLFLGTVFSDYPATYQWRKNGVVLAGETADFLYLPNIDLEDAGTYDVVATANSLSITSQLATLNVSGTFTKVMTGPLVNEGGNSTGSAWGDFDNDGDLDVFVTHGANAFNSLFRNNGNATFLRVDTAPVTTDSGNSAGATWADYDNDGWLDLLVLNAGNMATNVLYRNSGDGRFTRVTTGVGGELGNAQAAAWCDYDRDGWLDLATPTGGGGFGGGPTTGGLYHNEAGTLIRNTNAGLAALNQAQSVAWADFDNDGDSDLFYALATGGGFFGGPGHEQLYINGGPLGFVLFQEDPLVSSGNSSTTASWADYDNDGDMDVFVGNIDGQVKFLFRNTGSSSFVQVLGEIAAEAGANESAIWGDYDNDGWIDLFVANNLGGGSFLFRNTGSGAFTMLDVGSPTGDRANSVGAAWVDIDDNGFLDLFVTNLGDNNFLYRNNGNTNAWLSVKCAAYLSNRSAVGAKVRLLATIGGTPRWQVREIAARDSSGSPNSLRAEFGLGDAAVATTVRVEWPSGLVTELHDVPLRQVLTVEEPPTISIADAQVQEGDAGTRTMDFVVRLRAPSTNVVTVDFSTRNGTAAAGTHYAATNGTLSFAPGETSLTISVSIFGNVANGLSRSFLVVLTNATNMPIGRGTATGTILEDDPLTLSIDNASVVEGDSDPRSLVFSIYLNKPWTAPVTVDFGTANNNAAAGLDYVSTNGALIFNPGDVSKEVSVIVLGDMLNEANEVMFMNVSNAMGANLARFRASGTIFDNDPLPVILVTTQPVMEGAPLIFSVRLSARSGRTVSFAYATANGSAVAPADYVAKSGTISMMSGVMASNITIVVNADALPEGDEMLNIALSNPVGGVFETNMVVAVIRDDDFRITMPMGPAGPVSFYGVSNRYHRVERTFSLVPPVQWTTVAGASAILANGGLIQVHDPEASNATQRFYRVRLLQ